MTTLPMPEQTRASSATRSYAHAHWYLLAAFLAIVAGFWPTFYHTMGSGSVHANVHGMTSTLWYIALIMQAWLMSRGIVRWHRRIGIFSVVVLLPALCVSALQNTSIMLTSSATIPPPARPIIAMADFQVVLQLLVFVALGLRNRKRNSSAHKRYMAATAFVGFGPALARLYHNIGFDYFGPINGPFLTACVVLLTLIFVDWRNGERHWPYPIMFVWNVALMLLIVPFATSTPWLAFCNWFAA